MNTPKSNKVEQGLGPDTFVSEGLEKVNQIKKRIARERKYLVVWTSGLTGIDYNTKENYRAFTETVNGKMPFVLANDFYKTLLEKKDTLSASITKILESTDY